jgi:DNA-binding transcriptional ArsR family regulator
MRTPIHPSKEDLTLTRALYALSDPARLAIVQNLARKGEQACGALCQDMAKSTASHHFRVLREAGIIRMTADGTQFINKEDLESRFPGLLDAVLRSSVMAK